MGSIESSSVDGEFDRFERLDGLVRSLVGRFRESRQQCRALSGNLEQRDQRIRELEAQLLESNQLRVDVAKRIDDLIAQIDAIDSAEASE